MKEHIDVIGIRNRNNYPADELFKLHGKHVAWSRDNTRVIAASEDIWEVFKEIDRLGIPSSDYILEFVFCEPTI